MFEIKDITNITISEKASSIADAIMLGTKLFKDKADVLTFAAGYMIKNYYAEFDPSTYTMPDSFGSNFGSSTYDPDRKWAVLIQALYGNTLTPYLYLRALMDKGLCLIQQRIDSEPSFRLIDEL